MQPPHEDDLQVTGVVYETRDSHMSDIILFGSNQACWLNLMRVFHAGWLASWLNDWPSVAVGNFGLEAKR